MKTPEEIKQKIESIVVNYALQGEELGLVNDIYKLMQEYAEQERAEGYKDGFAEAGADVLSQKAIYDSRIADKLKAIKEEYDDDIEYLKPIDELSVYDIETLYKTYSIAERERYTKLFKSLLKLVE